MRNKTQCGPVILKRCPAAARHELEIIETWINEGASWPDSADAEDDVGNWDGHKMIADQYPGHAEILDQPAAALFQDLKRRGLLDDTLFVFCTEFGRMPTFQAGASGRDHNPAGFTCFLAGAGVKAPLSFGATDEFGWRAVQNVTTVYDFHATILHLLGLDHQRLTYYHNGTHRRLTDVHGHVLRAVLA